MTPEKSLWPTKTSEDKSSQESPLPPRSAFLIKNRSPKKIPTKTARRNKISELTKQARNTKMSKLRKIKPNEEVFKDDTNEEEHDDEIIKELISPPTVKIDEKNEKE